MSVTIKDVEHIAKLANLEFTDKEKEKFIFGLFRCDAYRVQAKKSGFYH